MVDSLIKHSILECFHFNLYKLKPLFLLGNQPAILRLHLSLSAVIKQRHRIVLARLNSRSLGMHHGNVCCWPTLAEGLVGSLKKIMSHVCIEKWDVWGFFKALCYFFRFLIRIQNHYTLTKPLYLNNILCRIQVCPKKGTISTILFWGMGFLSYTRDSSGFLG